MRHETKVVDVERRADGDVGDVVVVVSERMGSMHMAVGASALERKLHTSVELVFEEEQGGVG